MKRILFVLFVTLFSFVSKAASVDTIEIYSAAMKRSLKCVVILPASYNDSNLRFPVVYLLHGYSGDYSNWVKNAPGILQDADQYQMIFMCPYGGYNSWYFDSPADPKSNFKTYIGREVPAFVDSAYRTKGEKSHRAITGLSMGGHGALYLALQFPDIFGAAGSMSGGVDLLPWKGKFGLPEVLGDTTNTAVYIANSIVNMVRDSNRVFPQMIIDCGVADFFLGDNRNLHSALLENKISHDYIERPGQHSFIYWRNAVRYQNLFFYRFFNALE